MKGLVLSGGGARGAYQVGVLQAVADIASQLKISRPFDILTGVSAGSINASYLAAGAEDFSLTSKRLADLWAKLNTDNVFRSDAASLGRIGLKWMGELSFGAIAGGSSTRALLDTEPLGDLIRNNLEFAKIQQNINAGNLFALALTALDYKTSEAITFVQGSDRAPMWERYRRRSESTKISTGHIMASSAIPLLFPPIEVDGRHYGDGCVRNLVPCSPALHLGADKLFIIGVRTQKETAYDTRVKKSTVGPSVARVINVLLNSVLLDGVEVDVERLKRINDFVAQVPADVHHKINFKPVDFLFISPSEDLGAIAASMANQLPRLIRYLLKGLGPLEDASEVISYLLFEKEFLTKLIDCGYQDAIKQKDRIETFLRS